MGKNYGGLIPLVILTKRGKLRFLKPQGNVSYALLNLFNSYGFMTHPPFVYQCVLFTSFLHTSIRISRGIFPPFMYSCVYSPFDIFRLLIQLSPKTRARIVPSSPTQSQYLGRFPSLMTRFVLQKSQLGDQMRHRMSELMSKSRASQFVNLKNLDLIILIKSIAF